MVKHAGEMKELHYMVKLFCFCSVRMNGFIDVVYVDRLIKIEAHAIYLHCVYDEYQSTEVASSKNKCSPSFGVMPDYKSQKIFVL